MNYKKLYYFFANEFKKQSLSDEIYTEEHHIIPCHAGGDESPENLVKVTYRQHTFLHHLRWKAYNEEGDLLAYRLMRKIEPNKKAALASMAGKIGGQKNRLSGHMSNIGKRYGKKQGHKNVETGLLDSIRHLANNEIQQRKVRELGIRNKESGLLQKAAKQAYAVRENNSLARSNKVIQTAIRNEEYLHKDSQRSDFVYVSPEGLHFSSAYYAAKYYGNEKANVILSWCDRNKFGWYKIPKQK